LNSTTAEINVNFEASAQVHIALTTLAVKGQGHLLQKNKKIFQNQNEYMMHVSKLPPLPFTQEHIQLVDP
jgi:hypothetical protein